MKRTGIAIFAVLIAVLSVYWLYLQNSGLKSGDKAAFAEINLENRNDDKNINNTLQNPKPDINGNLPMSPDIERIVKKGELIVAVHSEDQPPCIMTDANGQLYGYDISLAKGIARDLGVKIKFDRTAKSFNDLFKMVAQRKCDIVISKFSQTFERAKSISYTRPYLNIKQSLLVNRMDLVKNKAESNPMRYLRNSKIKVGVIANSAYVNYSQGLFPGAELVEYKDWDKAINDVKSGNINVAFYDDIEIVRLVRNNPDIVLYTSVYVLKDKKDPIAIGVNSNDKSLRDWLNIYLDTYEINEDINSLIKKYPEIFSEKKNQNQGGRVNE